MKHKEFIKKIALGLACIGGLASCAIENDIPYPIIEGAITGMTVEGQRGETTTEFEAASINNTARTVTIYVNDSVDITDLRITQLSVSNNAELLADSAACDDYEHFPQEGFSSLDSIPVSSNTRMDFSKPVNFTLRTYQDYVWKVTVNQIIERKINVTGMIHYEMDEQSRIVIIYVGTDQDLSHIQINTLNLGGEYGRVRYGNSEDIVGVYDFSTSSQTFFAARANEDQWLEWKVYVYYSENEAETSGNVFPMCTRATLNGNIQSGKTPIIEYREQNASAWETLSASSINVNGTNYTASFSGLKPGTAYQYRVSVDGIAGEEQSFTTVAAIALENGSFDNWSSEAANFGTLWKPWSTTSFWDTGNKGATTIGDSNSTPTDETCNGSGRAASLETRWVVLKLAAGNIFTGTYVRTDGTNGILHFGREFSSFPTKLRINYKYTSSTINRVGDDDLEYLKGRADSCHIYIALTDWDQPYEIRTRKSERQLFDKNDSH